MTDVDTKSIVEWLIDGARSEQEAEGVLAALCERLVACGLPLWRVAVFVRTLHPEVIARRFVWQPGQSVAVASAPYKILESTEYQASPMMQIYRTGIPIRRRLA